MEQEFLLTGRVQWSHADEFAKIDSQTKAMALIVSLGGPLHHHKGNIGLTDDELFIEGYENDLTLQIPLNRINEIYMGFDDVFTNTSVKNFGAF